MSEYDPRRSKTVALAEVRTVLSRARSARAIILSNEEMAKQWPGRGYEHGADDLNDIVEALDKTIAALEPWERHGNRAGRGGRSVR